MKKEVLKPDVIKTLKINFKNRYYKPRILVYPHAKATVFKNGKITVKKGPLPVGIKWMG